MVYHDNKINCRMPSIYMASVAYKIAGRHPRYRGHCVPSGHSTVKIEICSTEDPVGNYNDLTSNESSSLNFLVYA